MRFCRWICHVLGILRQIYYVIITSQEYDLANWYVEYVM